MVDAPNSVDSRASALVSSLPLRRNVDKVGTNETDVAVLQRAIEIAKEREIANAGRREAAGFRTIQNALTRQMGKVRTAEIQGVSVGELRSRERTAIARERAVAARVAREAEAADDSVLTPQTRVNDSVSLARSEKTGRTILIRQGGTGINDNPVRSSNFPRSGVQSSVNANFSSIDGGATFVEPPSDLLVSNQRGGVQKPRGSLSEANISFFTRFTQPLRQSKTLGVSDVTNIAAIASIPLSSAGAAGGAAVSGAKAGAKGVVSGFRALNKFDDFIFSSAPVAGARGALGKILPQGVVNFGTKSAIASAEVAGIAAASSGVERVTRGDVGVDNKAFNEAVNIGIGASVAPKGASVNVFGNDVTVPTARDFFAGITLFGGDRGTFRSTVTQQFRNAGLEGEELAQAVAAAERSRKFRGTSEAVNLLNIARSSERIGRQGVTDAFEAAGAKGVTFAKGDAFSKIFRTTAIPIGGAGVFEGSASVVAQDFARGQDIRARDVALGGLVGGVTAAGIGGFIAGSRVNNPNLSKGTELITNIIDPFEKGGDLLADAQGAVNKRFFGKIDPVPVISTNKPDTILGFGSPEVSGGSKRSRAKSSRVASVVPVSVPSPVTLDDIVTPPVIQPPSIVPSVVPPVSPTPVPSIVASPTPVPINSFLPTLTESPTPVPVTVPTPVPLPIPITSPQPRIPLLPPLGFGFGGGGAGTRKGRGAGFADELAAGANLLSSLGAPVAVGRRVDSGRKKKKSGKKSRKRNDDPFLSLVFGGLPNV